MIKVTKKLAIVYILSTICLIFSNKNQTNASEVNSAMKGSLIQEIKKDLWVNGMNELKFPNSKKIEIQEDKSAPDLSLYLKIHHLLQGEVKKEF